MQCIEGTATRNANGYGVTNVTVGKNKQVMIYAHRVAFEKTWGYSLKPDQVVRHTCDNPSCINPLHLQLGKQLDNVNDMVQRGRVQRTNAFKTHCVNGHEFTVSNTWTNGKRRQCRTCLQARKVASRA